MWLTAEGEWTPGRVDIQGTLQELRNECPWIKFLTVTRCSNADCTVYGNSESMFALRCGVRLTGCDLSGPQVTCLQCYDGSGGGHWSSYLSILVPFFFALIAAALYKCKDRLAGIAQTRFANIRWFPRPR